MCYIQTKKLRGIVIYTKEKSNEILNKVFAVIFLPFFILYCFSPKEVWDFALLFQASCAYLAIFSRKKLHNICNALYLAVLQIFVSSYFLIDHYYFTPVNPYIAYVNLDTISIAFSVLVLFLGSFGLKVLCQTEGYTPLSAQKFKINISTGWIQAVSKKLKQFFKNDNTQ